MLKIRFKNKKYSAVWLVEPHITIGRARDNQLVVSAPNVADHHLQIQVEHETLELVNQVPGSDVTVNGEAVAERCALTAKDAINLAGIELEVIDPKDDVGPEEALSTNPRAPQSTGWAIKANHSALDNRVYPLGAHNVVGRSSDCDITLPEAHLSRRHAELSVKDGVLYVKDLGSANGTYLNAKRVTEARVKRGDELRFDALSFGVIGPADDMSKTTVRSTVKPGAKSAAPSRKPSRPAASASAPKAAPPKPEPQPDKPRYGVAGLVVLAALTAVVVVALYLTRG